MVEYPHCQCLQVFPGDWFEWSCTFNTSLDNKVVIGGYDFQDNEMCNVNIDYAPYVSGYRGCIAVPKEYGALATHVATRPSAQPKRN
jgi:hypothetical protein